MKKWLLMTTALVLALALSACGGSAGGNTTPSKAGDSASPKVSSGTPSAAKTSSTPAGNSPAKADNTVSPKGETASWPAALKDWGVPMPVGAKVVAVEDKSASGNVLTQGVNTIVNLGGVTKKTFDEYCAALEKQGFVKNPDSIGDAMVVFNKEVTNGTMKLTLSFSDSGMTLIANNSAAAAQKNEQPAGAAIWPEALKDIPEFTKGKFKETVDMGGSMYAITFTGVTSADLDQYRDALLKAGFARQDDTDTEGYSKLDAKKAYSVGFVVDGDTLQLVAAVGSY